MWAETMLHNHLMHNEISTVGYIMTNRIEPNTESHGNPHTSCIVYTTDVL